MSDEIRDPDHLSRMDYYSLIREQLDNENDLLNQRVMWHVVGQSFLFSSYIMLVNAPKEARNEAVEWLHGPMFWLIGVLGLSVSLLTFPAIYSSIAYMRCLREDYERYDVKGQASNRFPAIGGDKRLRQISYITPLGLPIAFTLAWLISILLQVIAAWTT